MALQSVKLVSVKAVKQIEEIMQTNPDGYEDIKNAILKAIDKLHNKVHFDTHLLITEEAAFQITPKKEFKQYMLDITGEKGPYNVVKTYKSWVGISDGLYEVENCGKLIPASWCRDRKQKSDTLKLLSILLAISSVIQSALLLFLII